MNYTSLKELLCQGAPQYPGAVRAREVVDYFEQLSIRRYRRLLAFFLIVMGGLLLGLNAPYLRRDPGPLQWLLLGVVVIGFPVSYAWKSKRAPALTIQKRLMLAHELSFCLGILPLGMILVLLAVLFLKMLHVNAFRAVLFAGPVTIPGLAFLTWWLSGKLRKRFDPYYME